MIIIKVGKKILIAIVLVIISTAAWATPKPEANAKPEAKPAAVKSTEKKAEAPVLNVGKKGTYVYWFTYKDSEGTARTTLPQRFKGKSTDLDASDLGSSASGAKLYVMNKAKGGAAITDFNAKTPESIDLRQSDFQYARNVRLRIVSEDNKPLESALVNIEDGNGDKHIAVVTPADEGMAVFHDVAEGETNVKVEAEGARKTIDSDIEIPEGTPSYEQDVKVAGDVNTINVTSKTAGSHKTGDSAARPKQDKLSSILQTLVGLVFLGIIVLIVAMVWRMKGLTAQKALRSMGVEFPQDAAGNAAPAAPSEPVVDPNICPFCGQRKDANGNCACSITPGASPFGAAPAASSGIPRLIGSQGVYSGNIFELTSETAVLGREAGNDVALPNDNTASRKHATITKSNGDFIIRDEGSSNGTFVNGAKITEKKLIPGDEIQVGGTKFRFEV